MIFSFQMSANSSYIYNSTHYIYSSTATSLILILIYGLHTVRKSDTFPVFLLNIYSLAIFIFNLLLFLLLTILGVVSILWQAASITTGLFAYNDLSHADLY